VRATIKDSDLFGLTEDECTILDAIPGEPNRFTTQATEGKLEWGLGLRVDDKVLARLPEDSTGGEVKYATSVVRWIGTVQVQNGTQHYFGVEIKVSFRLASSVARGGSRISKRGVLS
jgi:hypothetical protein